jgi:hypothetical protein
MDGASMIIWFGLLMLGALFIGLALRDEGRIDKKEDESIRQIRDVSNLPLNHVREALRPPPPARPAPTDRPRTSSPHPHRPRHPSGPRLVR